MCGIAGTINCSLTESDIDLISHRGPDARGLVRMESGLNTIWLGHTRLSILDLSEAGNQPMFTDCGNYCIVFNGEIYNHWDLRKKLGHINFTSQSDTETILYYLREFGMDGIKDFNGIFAFALVDLLKGKLFLAKDWFGVKPLYYYKKDNQLVFGSELKVILNNPVYEKKIDSNALNSFLTLRYNPAPETLFSGIKKLEAASYLEFDQNANTRITHFWSKKQKIISGIDEQEAIKEYQRLLSQAVSRQLLSDVPVGLLLSGGLDSAVLGHLMAEKSGNPIKTFTVGFPGKGDFNELDDARETARYIGSEHEELYMNKEQYMAYFFKSFFYTEEPIAEPTIPALFYVSNLAAGSVKVVLSGQGADETMAGYKRYKGERFISSYRNVLKMLPLGMASSVFSNNSTIERGIYSSRFENELDRFLAIYTLFTPELKKNLFRDDYQSLVNADQHHLFNREYEHTDKTADSLSRMLFLDTRTMLPDNLLLFNDKMTMANSLENRVPYLDIDLVNFLESLPIHLKLRGNKGKYIHRKAAASWLPDSIINRKKRGFQTPVGDWFRKELSDTLVDLINSKSSVTSQYFKPDFIKEMVIKHKSGKKDYGKHLFILLSLELWYKDFFTTRAYVPAIAV